MAEGNVWPARSGLLANPGEVAGLAAALSDPGRVTPGVRSGLDGDDDDDALRSESMLDVKKPDIERLPHDGLGECDSPRARRRLAVVGNGVRSPDESTSLSGSRGRWRCEK